MKDRRVSPRHDVMQLPAEGPIKAPDVRDSEAHVDEWERSYCLPERQPVYFRFIYEREVRGNVIQVRPLTPSGTRHYLDSYFDELNTDRSYKGSPKYL